MCTSLSKPHFDINISNHVTMVNFFVTTEGLEQLLLSMVVANERQDLEESFSDNSKATFDNIKNLKDIENVILSNLKVDVDQILGDESLISTLNESKNIAELIA